MRVLYSWDPPSWSQINLILSYGQRQHASGMPSQVSLLSRTRQLRKRAGRLTRTGRYVCRTTFTTVIIKKGKVVQCHLCQLWINSECVSQKRQRYCRNIDLSDLPQTATTGSIIRPGGNDGSPRGIEQATRCPRRRATTGDERPMR